jgi:hypothetical protein
VVDSGATKRREGKLVELHEENNDGVCCGLWCFLSSSWLG